jgi:hypothetical protein
MSVDNADQSNKRHPVEDKSQASADASRTSARLRAAAHPTGDHSPTEARRKDKPARPDSVSSNPLHGMIMHVQQSWAQAVSDVQQSWQHNVNRAINDRILGGNGINPDQVVSQISPRVVRDLAEGKALKEQISNGEKAKPLSANETRKVQEYEKFRDDITAKASKLQVSSAGNRVAVHLNNEELLRSLDKGISQRYQRERPNFEPESASAFSKKDIALWQQARNEVLTEEKEADTIFSAAQFAQPGDRSKKALAVAATTTQMASDEFKPAAAASAYLDMFRKRLLPESGVTSQPDSTRQETASSEQLGSLAKTQDVHPLPISFKTPEQFMDLQKSAATRGGRFLKAEAFDGRAILIAISRSLADSRVHTLMSSMNGEEREQRQQGKPSASLSPPGKSHSKAHPSSPVNQQKNVSSADGAAQNALLRNFKTSSPLSPKHEFMGRDAVRVVLACARMAGVKSQSQDGQLSDRRVKPQGHAPLTDRLTDSAGAGAHKPENGSVSLRKTLQSVDRGDAPPVSLRKTLQSVDRGDGRPVSLRKTLQSVDRGDAPPASLRKTLQLVDRGDAPACERVVRKSRAAGQRQELAPVRTPSATTPGVPARALRLVRKLTADIGSPKRPSIGIDLALGAILAGGGISRLRAESSLSAKPHDLDELPAKLSLNDALKKQFERLVSNLKIHPPLIYVTEVDKIAVSKLEAISTVAELKSDSSENNQRKLGWQADIDEGGSSTGLVKRVQPTLDDDESMSTTRLIGQRPTAMVGLDDTLVSIAEAFYFDPNVAWLIADLNKLNTKQTLLGGKRIVEVSSRQMLVLPLPQDIEEFEWRRGEEMNGENIVTIVEETQVDKELLASFLGNVISNSTTSSTNSTKAKPIVARKEDDTK